MPSARCSPSRSRCSCRRRGEYTATVTSPTCDPPAMTGQRSSKGIGSGSPRISMPTSFRVIPSSRILVRASLADEVARCVQIDEPFEPDLERVGGHVHVAPVAEDARLDAVHVRRAGHGDPERLAGRQHPLPERVSVAWVAQEDLVLRPRRSTPSGRRRPGCRPGSSPRARRARGSRGRRRAPRSGPGTSAPGSGRATHRAPRSARPCPS